jgi:hypothetical protein
MMSLSLHDRDKASGARAVSGRVQWLAAQAHSALNIEHRALRILS